MGSSPNGVSKYIVYEDNRWLPTTCESPEIRYATGFQARTTGGAKPPHMRTVLLRMGQAPPIHHVTQTAMTVNRLLICFKKF